MQKLLFGALVVLLSACGRSVERQIQDQVRTFDTAHLEENKIEVKEIRTVGDQAVAEIQITTAVRLSKQNGKWVIEEFRLGDRRWEKAEHIAAILREERTRSTRDQMDQIAEGIQRYAASRGQVPQVSDFSELMDILVPRFLPSGIRADAWLNPFSYEARGHDQFELRSAGPDGILQNADDLWIGADSN